IAAADETYVRRVSDNTLSLTAHETDFYIPNKNNVFNDIELGCRCALSPGARQRQENQHAAASCDLKQKIEIHRGLSGSGALADQHSSGSNCADRHAQARAGAGGKDSTQQSAISIQPGLFLKHTQTNSIRPTVAE